MSHAMTRRCRQLHFHLEDTPWSLEMIPNTSVNQPEVCWILQLDRPRVSFLLLIAATRLVMGLAVC